jgi:hypothetical protein
MITAPCLTLPSQPVRYTLDPLAELGPDALAPDAGRGIKGVFLQELGIGWENVFQEVIVRRASDVFACAAAAGFWYDTLPPGARPVCAILRFHLAGPAPPCLAEIWPPHTLVLTPASAAEFIEGWLTAHGFAVTG